MMGQRLTRRGVVKGPGLAPLVGVALPGAADASTPVMVEFAKYQTRHRQIDACVVGMTVANEKVVDAMFAQCDLIEDQLMALPCLTAADFAAKVIVDTAQEGATLSDTFPFTARFEAPVTEFSKLQNPIYKVDTSSWYE